MDLHEQPTAPIPPGTTLRGDTRLERVLARRHRDETLSTICLVIGLAVGFLSFFLFENFEDLPTLVVGYLTAIAADLLLISALLGIRSTQHRPRTS